MVKKENFKRFISLQSPLAWFIIVLMMIMPLISDSYYLIEVLKLAAIYAIFATSWDVLTGYTDNVNFGFAFFIGGSAYMSAILNYYMALPPVISVMGAALVTGFLGIVIGWLTLRLEGPYFSMATIVFANVLFKLCFIYYKVTGGEEGLSGLDSFFLNPIGDYYVVMAVMVFAYVVLFIYGNSNRGSILKAIRASEDATQSAGINTAYYKIEAFTISGLIAGLGGGVYAQSMMHVGPTMASGYMSVIIVLLAMIGGMGTITGPLLGAILLSGVNEGLRIVEEYRIAIYSGLLVLLMYIFPDGVINTKYIKNSKVLRYVILGERKEHDTSKY